MKFRTVLAATKTQFSVYSLFAVLIAASSGVELFARHLGGSPLAGVVIGVVGALSLLSVVFQAQLKGLIVVVPGSIWAVLVRVDTAAVGVGTAAGLIVQYTNSFHSPFLTAVVAGVIEAAALAGGLYAALVRVQTQAKATVRHG
ncbi:MAG TPA: hypothetical protein VMW80_14260 [Candidatus Dormibacteraeota bacterium]|nr:hypothetical protein [Candidatus Dormibacteraeota bacterium]